MGDVVGIKGEAAVENTTEATAKIVAWLRDQADALESGEARPAHKAVLVVLEHCSGQIRIGPAFCNTSAAERVGIMYMALHDIASAD